MRASGSSPLGILLLAAPLIAVPLLAVFGIPQFAPGVVTSSLSDDDSEELQKEAAPRRRRAGSADDLFQSQQDEFEAALDARPRARRSTVKSEDTVDNDLPEEALQGWKMVEVEDQFASNSTDTDEVLPSRTPRRQSRSKSKSDSELSEEGAEFERSESHPLTKETDSRDYERPAPRRKSRTPSDSSRDEQEPVAEESENPDEEFAQVKHEDQEEPASSSEKRRKDGDRPSVVHEEFTWRKASRRLHELGTNVKSHWTMDEDQEMYVFHCEISPPDAPNLHQKFEARGYEPMLTVYDVIRQIEDWVSDRRENVARRDRKKKTATP